MPRSRLLLVLIFVAFAVVCVRLGIWQLDRLSERREANAAALGRRTLPEVILPSALPAESLDGRRVRASGHYDSNAEVLLRGQVFNDVPGVVLVTPLRLDGAGDTAVVVERGFVPSPDALTLSSDSGLEEAGPREVSGLAVALADSADAQPLEHRGRLSLRRLDLTQLRRRIATPILPVVIRQLADSAAVGFPRRRPAPPLDEGPHRLYAIQWFAFAATGIVFAGIFLWKGARTPEGRADRAPPAA
jgi:surfeit locus 1 family protein